GRERSRDGGREEHCGRGGTRGRAREDAREDQGRRTKPLAARERCDRAWEMRRRLVFRPHPCAVVLVALLVASAAACLASTDAGAADPLQRAGGAFDAGRLSP